MNLLRKKEKENFYLKERKRIFLTGGGEDLDTYRRN